MFSRFATLLSAIMFAAVAVAAPSGINSPSVCSSGNEYCCNQLLSGPTAVTGALGGLLSIPVGAGVGAGLTCTPVTVIGTGSGGGCSQHTACCGNDLTSGVANILCSPVGAHVGS